MITGLNSEFYDLKTPIFYSWMNVVIMPRNYAKNRWRKIYVQKTIKNKNKR